MADDLPEISPGHDLLWRLAVAAAVGVPYKTHAILGTVILEIAKRDARTQRAEAALARASKTISSAHLALATGADDWGASEAKAWLYGLIVGWECGGGHDEPCDEFCGGDGPLKTVAERYGWGDAKVARLRALHAGILNLGEPPVEPSSLDQGPEPVRWNVCPDCFDRHPGGAACYGEDVEVGAGSLDQGTETPASITLDELGMLANEAIRDHSLCVNEDTPAERVIPPSLLWFVEDYLPNKLASLDQGTGEAPDA